MEIFIETLSKILLIFLSIQVNSMKNLDYYQSLPESPSVELMENEFDYLIDNLLLNLNFNDLLPILYELSDRQWNTYTIANDKIKNAVSEYLIKFIDVNSENDIDSALHISLAMGLSSVYFYILDNFNNIINVNVKNLINEYKREVVDITNPYIGIVRRLG